VVIAIADEKDTLSVEHFDVSGNLVFRKNYPYDSDVGIWAFSYNDDNRRAKYIKTSPRYTGYDLMFGFFMEIYEYDSLQNIIKTFRYEYEFKSNFRKVKSFTSKINNTKDLEESKPLKKMVKQGRYMSNITYFTDTLPIKTIYFTKNGDTSYITNYSYNHQDLLIFEFSPAGKEISYLYDTLGRILYSENKGLFTSSRYDYETPNIIKILYTYSSFNLGEVVITKIAEYEDDKIVKETFYYRNNSGPYRVVSYEYDEENRLVCKCDSNYEGRYCISEPSVGRPLTIKYIYITK